MQSASFHRSERKISDSADSCVAKEFLSIVDRTQILFPFRNVATLWGRQAVILVNWTRRWRNAMCQEESTLSWTWLIIHARPTTTDSVPQKCQRRDATSRMESANTVHCRRKPRSCLSHGPIAFLFPCNYSQLPRFPIPSRMPGCCKFTENRVLCVGWPTPSVTDKM